jgi:hypothetical protein
MNTHLLLEAIIAATSVMGLSSSLAGLWFAKRAAGKAAGEVTDAIEEPVGKTTDTVGGTAGRVKKVPDHSPRPRPRTSGRQHGLRTTPTDGSKGFEAKEAS